MRIGEVALVVLAVVVTILVFDMWQKVEANAKAILERSTQSQVRQRITVLGFASGAVV
jgi:hypothetical protein